MPDDHPLSIAYVVPNWPPSRVSNGIISYVSNILPGMTALGHRISLISSGDPDPDDAGRVYRLQSNLKIKLVSAAVHRLKLGASPTWLMGDMIASAARSIDRDSKLDLIEMEESFGWADPVRRRLHIPTVVRLHGPWFLNGEALGGPRDAEFFRRVREEGRTLARARWITAPSADVLERTRNYYGLPLVDAEVVPNPVRIPPESSHWNLAGCDRDQIVFVGRFDRHKGGDLAIDAFAKLAPERPRARLTFIGNEFHGFSDDQGRVWSLPEYASSRLDAATASRFEWLGARPHNEIDGFRRRALITVIASRYENFPTVVLEAKALGCPIVAARTGGIPEIIRDGVDGLLFEPGDAGDLAAKITALLDDPDRAAALGREAAADARRFDPVAVAENMTACYRRLLLKSS